MGTVSIEHFHLLLGSGVKRKIGLVGEIIGVKDNFDGIRFADECLRLLRLATKLTRFPSIRYVGFGVAVHNLQIATLTMRRIEKVADFELFEIQPHDEISRRPTEAAESIPAGQGPVSVGVGHLRRGHILVDVDRFVAVVLAGVGVTASFLRR